jgi:AI-2 transport protein TqsA
MTSDKMVRGSLLFIACGVAVAGLYWFREVLTQFALGVFLWLSIEAAVRGIRRVAPFIHRVVALPVAIVLVLAIIVGIIALVGSNAAMFAQDAEIYRGRLDALLARTYTGLGLDGMAPQLADITASIDPTRVATTIGQAAQSILGNTVFILIYAAFLLAASRTFPGKMRAMFPNFERRQEARHVVADIRHAMEQYLWVQTVCSIIITVLTYFTLLAIGLEHALFWSFVIFFLNYIPTVGSLVAVAMPTAFAAIQFESPLLVGAVAGGVGLWQFVIGNFIQPRMTGLSLNLSTVAVLLSLSLWGSVWGPVGMFLSAPLTVAIMLVLAKEPETKWLAIMMSDDGHPGEKPIPKTNTVHDS